MKLLFAWQYVYNNMFAKQERGMGADQAQKTWKFGFIATGADWPPEGHEAVSKDPFGQASYRKRRTGH
ncbi:MAG: hypothetical protein RI973_1779, partial [Bacteroidota bacterium]